MRNLLIVIVVIFLAAQSNFARPTAGKEGDNPRRSNHIIPGLQHKSGARAFHRKDVGGRVAPLHMSAPQSPKPQTISSSLLNYRAPFSLIFKYDTSRNNPEHRCYDIRKPLTRNYTFLFNFLSSQQYLGAGSP